MQKFATYLKTIYPQRYKARQVTIYEYIHPETDLSDIVSEEVSETSVSDKPDPDLKTHQTTVGSFIKAPTESRLIKHSIKGAVKDQRMFEDLRDLNLLSPDALRALPSTNACQGSAHPFARYV